MVLVAVTFAILRGDIIHERRGHRPESLYLMFTSRQQLHLQVSECILATSPVFQMSRSVLSISLHVREYHPDAAITHRGSFRPAIMLVATYHYPIVTMLTVSLSGSRQDLDTVSLMRMLSFIIILRRVVGWMKHILPLVGVIENTIIN